VPQGSLGSTFGEPFTEDLEVMDSSSHRGHGARERPAPADIPDHVEYLIIGAGVHGLSTAWHLGLRMKAEGKDPSKAFSYHPVGYMQISCESMRADVESIAQRHEAVGYESRFIDGARASDKYMKGLFHDWQAKGITSVLHEKRGGYANNIRSMEGVEVLGFESAGSGDAVTKVLTNAGPIACENVVVAVGPWVKQIWDMLELPKAVMVKDLKGVTHCDVPMWKYWSLQEGTLGVDPDLQRTNDGGLPPVLHVDTDAPLYSDRDGSLITDKLWGIYYKPDTCFDGVQGGAMPYRIETDPDDVKVDPYGPESPDFIVGDEFAHAWTSALAFCQKRFEGKSGLYRDEPSGGIGCFTPDSFPVFDRFRENVYIIADSNHGYKMIGVGALVAQELLGETSSILEPFRFSRYAEGRLHPVSHSPFPWS
jgi:glycine/D-amino acid oxidase-like deaminating enzyme